MTRKIIIRSLVFALLMVNGIGGGTTILSAQNIEPFPTIKDTDRILILAPHPDDETIGTAGVIQEAIKKKIPIKIVYLTNGDSNELAFIMYKKRLVFRKSSVLHMGQVRRKEAIAAMTSLGLNEDHLVFLGYPDLGTLNIFTQYWGDTRPFKSLLSRAKKVPYKECLSPGAPYVGESILNDLKLFLKAFKPTLIFTTSPMDTNSDHRAAYLFLQVALWDLKKDIPSSEIYPFLIHMAKWPMPRGFDPRAELLPPEKISHSKIRWNSLKLSEDQILNKRNAIELYKSQLAYSQPFLLTFARKNELFLNLPSIVLRNEISNSIHWDQLDEEENILSHFVDEEKPEEHLIEEVTYAKKDEDLFIKIHANRFTNEIMSVNIHLLGYHKSIPFAKMPKINIRIIRGKATVYERRQRLFYKDLSVISSEKEMLLQLPLSLLNNPHYILSNVRASITDIPVEATAWQTLIIKTDE